MFAFEMHIQFLHMRKGMVLADVASLKKCEIEMCFSVFCRGAKW